jgi:predicted metal-dependent HD superfamily phosphohydrolase
MPADLTARWTMDVRGITPDPPGDVVERVGADLLARWSEPSRRYHTTTHLVEMFRALEELEAAGLIDDHQCAIARLAAWFHDAIYDPAATPGANEADSAVLARETLQRLSVVDEDIDTIERLIRLTARHDTDAEDPLDAAFQDADLWILSAPTSRFDGYCQQVRAEYAQVSDAVFRRGRMAVLGPLLERDKIYRTSRALHHWEGPARINLGRELTRLSVQP